MNIFVKSSVKRWVFGHCLKTARVSVALTVTGSLLHSFDAKAEKHLGNKVGQVEVCLML